MVCRIDRFTDRELNLMKSARDEILNEVEDIIESISGTIEVIKMRDYLLKKIKKLREGK
jgi:hypothetical protein